jgi:hypothetical protein
MANVVLSERYMDCPSHGCTNRIVKLLVCSGRDNPLHKGLPFRLVSNIPSQWFGDNLRAELQCNMCGYYNMFNEYEAAAAGFTFAEGQCAPQGQQEVNMPPASSASCITPKTPIAQCSVHRCRRKPAVECGMCKGCCEGWGLGCSSCKMHQNGPPRTKKASSFTFKRPPTASPPLQVTVPTVHSSSATTAPPLNIDPPAAAPQMPCLFRDKLSEQSLAEWKAREQAVEDLRVAASLRRQNKLSMAKQVVIRLWDRVCIFSCPLLSTYHYLV